MFRLPRLSGVVVLVPRRVRGMFPAWNLVASSGAVSRVRCRRVLRYQVQALGVDAMMEYRQSRLVRPVRLCAYRRWRGR